MYAVIRAGGKQYRVAPGDVIRLENQSSASDGKIEFGDVLAVSGKPGQIARPESEARVLGQVVEQGRGKKILVFHYKRKKQYRKLRGHRQGFTAVRITEIAYDGETFSAPEVPAKTRPQKVAAAHEPAQEHEAVRSKDAASRKPEHKAVEHKAAPHKAAAKDKDKAKDKKPAEKKSSAKKAPEKKAAPKKKK
ncbi:MAG: 50S ribosomal protein L21 [Acidobacteriales bacterium]|nr:50S ribosomal protein L21 [Terriglobales bacterium]